MSHYDTINRNSLRIFRIFLFVLLLLFTSFISNLFAFIDCFGRKWIKATTNRRKENEPKHLCINQIENYFIFLLFVLRWMCVVNKKCQPNEKYSLFFSVLISIFIFSIAKRKSEKTKRECEMSVGLLRMAIPVK